MLSVTTPTPFHTHTEAAVKCQLSWSMSCSLCCVCLCAATVCCCWFKKRSLLGRTLLTVIIKAGHRRRNIDIYFSRITEVHQYYWLQITWRQDTHPFKLLQSFKCCKYMGVTERIIMCNECHDHKLDKTRWNYPFLNENADTFLYTLTVHLNWLQSQKWKG